MSDSSKRDSNTRGSSTRDIEQLADLRLSYQKGSLDVQDVDACPFAQFAVWLEYALSTDLPEPYAMTLATCGADGRPSARTVLLRGSSPHGMLFYTNYDSQKGQNLAENPFAELLFYWPLLEQQVRIAGRVERISEQHSTDYFHSRPRDSQLGAWVSLPQSGVVDAREILEQRFLDLKAQHGDAEMIEKPDFWGGYRLVPDAFEFWQGRPNRMHDRLRYRLNDGVWVIERLMP